MSNFIPYRHPLQLSEEEMRTRVGAFYQLMSGRRTLRDFSPRAVPRDIIERIIMTASTAPSGAHKQPWTFCAVSDPKIKKAIREAAEKEEYENYHGRMSEPWLKDLEVFETNWQKPFLETAPWLIVAFKKPYDVLPDGSHAKNYYVTESMGLACGFLLTAIHNAGLVALTHTPSPMRFLQEVLERPENERAFLLIPVGYPPDDAKVPDLKRKGLDEVAVFY